MVKLSELYFSAHDSDQLRGPVDSRLGLLLRTSSPLILVAWE